MKEADHIYILDTGSTDDTIRKLSQYSKVTIKQKIIDPWRFDTARNLSLEMVPEDADICVCTDLDEIMLEGWRQELEQIWDSTTNRIRYNYNWSLDDNNNPKINFYLDNIHSRKNYIWLHPVHEVLTYQGLNEKIITTENIILNHYPDLTKSRKSYLPLLEMSVQEDPEDDRNMHYLGREYMYYHKWNQCIDTLIKHLKLKTSTWKDERSASMRFISRAYQGLERYDEAKMWLDKAIAEAPYLRDPYVERALLEYQLKNYNQVIKYCNQALTITTHQKNYINEPFSWDSTIYDLLSISYYYIGNIDKALENINKALEYQPTNERLLNNKKIYQSQNSSKESASED